eukprot:COSAG01_NODE_52865_length_343_cov_1.065574_1_plen_82_part_01
MAAAGLAVSVGGLTESTMKIGREELLTQVRHCALCTIRTASTPSVDARYEQRAYQPWGRREGLSHLRWFHDGFTMVSQWFHD